MKTTSIVFVPGLLCSGDLYLPQIAALEIDCRIADTLTDASITQMAERLLATAPAEFILCGLSMGGYVALEVMRQQPHRVRGLALMATSADPDTAEQTERRRRLISLARRDGVGTVARLLAERLFGPSARSDARLQRLAVEMAEAVGPEAFVRQQEAIIARLDQTGLLSSIAVPTEILAGTADEIIAPQRSREMAAAIPGAALTMLEGIGHMVSLEAPEVATGALQRLLHATSGRGAPE
ncbi:alpha/beta fold hydrolase [Jiella sp. M17.18]|uniref:alpha/beta fold hydrolase n=1 Tax=Jiella sp. M17.18 TaxID=3234247 RepID=UPI0034DE6151